MTALPTHGVHSGVDEAAYHGDRSSLSSTGAKTIISAGPRTFKHQQDHPVHKDAFDLGSVVHALILGVGDYQVIEHDSWRTKAAQAERDAARTEGKAPILSKDYAAAQDMADAVMSNKLAAAVLSDGKPEVSMWHEDPETGVRMRGRADYLRDGYLIDLKTAAGAIDPAAFEKKVWDMRYGLQMYWYRRILELNGVEAAPIWVVVSKDQPHEVYISQPSPELMERGREDAERALRIYADCLLTNEWPGLADDQQIHTIDLPRWAR